MGTKVKDLSCGKDVTETIVDDIYSSEETSDLNGISDDLFFSILNLPKCLKSEASSDCRNSNISLERIELNLKNFTVPDISIPAISVDTGYGHYADSSGKVDAYGEQTISIRMDDKMRNYYTLYRWMNLIRGFKDGLNEHCKPEYSTTFSVVSVDQFQCPIGLHTFKGVFPTTLGGYEMDTSTTGEDIYFDLTFSFDDVIFEMNDEYQGILDN